MSNPGELEVLGNGLQKKSYLYVQDCLDAIILATDKFNEKVNIVNLGTNEYCQVNDSIGWITQHLGLKPKLKYSGGKSGWIGDVPFIFLDTAKVNKAGFKTKLNIKEAVIKTLEYLEQNKWVLEQVR